MTRFLLFKLYVLSYFVLLLPPPSLAVDEDCKWSKRDVSPQVYFINMDKSADRKVNMERHLTNVGLGHERVRGLMPREIYIPEDIESSWRTIYCKLQTSWKPPVRKHLESTSAYLHHSSFMMGLCGRGKRKNNPKELGCTTSHLIAMKNAVYSNSKSRYALIVEDDVQFPFDVDWDALAESAPKNFSILQLFNSNEATMAQTWNIYKKDPNNLWYERGAKKFFDFWSTCAYLIDRVAMKPVIDAIVKDINGWTSFNIIAGMNMNPCVPAACCVNGTDYANFIHKAPCVWAPRGYQAGISSINDQNVHLFAFFSFNLNVVFNHYFYSDSFLYAMAKTYMLNIPLIANGIGGNQSTFHQDHVESVHRSAFRRQRQYVNEMLTGKVALPPFAKPACKPLDVADI